MELVGWNEPNDISNTMSVAYSPNDYLYTIDCHCTFLSTFFTCVNCIVSIFHTTAPFCNDPPPINFGKFNRIAYGQVEYSCQQPYLISGNSIRKCKEDRTWSGEEPECTFDSSISKNLY